jgi:hypothetical protein
LLACFTLKTESLLTLLKCSKQWVWLLEIALQQAIVPRHFKIEGGKILLQGIEKLKKENNKKKVIIILMDSMLVAWFRFSKIF